MALVAYGFGSDISDSEGDDQDSQQQDVFIPTRFDTKLILPKPKDQPEKPDENLFKILPKPKSDKWTGNVQEEEDEFLFKKETPTEELPPKPVLSKKKINEERKPAKILLPSLASFEKEEDDNIKPKFKASTKGFGLLGMLPEPKTSAAVLNKISSTKFVPNVLTKPPPKPMHKKPIESKKNSLLEISYDSSDDSDALSDSDVSKPIDFFSLNKVEEPIAPEPVEEVPEPSPPKILPHEVEHYVYGQVEPIATNIDMDYNYEADEDDYGNADDNYGDSSPETGNKNKSHIGPESQSVVEAPIDDEALRKLCGSRERRKVETMEFIDIDQKEILPDRREWMTKALTENTGKRMSSGKRSGDQPSGQQKRKHQITYLAHQARANEQELQNQWANNRMSRKQTQSKYGF